MKRMKLIHRKEAFPVREADCLEKCMEFIRSELKNAGIDKRNAVQTQLLAEEILAAMIEESKGGDIRIQIKKILGDMGILISAKGNELALFENQANLSDEIEDDDALDAIRSIILKSKSENFKYKHKNGINSVRIMVGKPGISSVRLTAAALAAGLLFGVLLKMLLPENAVSAVCSYLLSPVSDMFMSALKCVIAPVVFFSIVTCISGFGDLSDLGRMGAKVMGMYLFTTVIAVAMAFVVTIVISPGTFGAGLGMTGVQAVDVSTDVDTSLINTIINIVPSNLVRPFLESDTLQLIFLAVLIGIAVGKIGEYTPVLTDLFEACNSLFLTLTTMIARFIPVCVFCSVALMIVNMGVSSFRSMLSFFLTNTLAIGIMILIYGLLVLVMGRSNPITFFRKAKEGMLTSFTLSSSAAAIPTNIRVCTEKLGISPKVCNFSIPLGATINMDGTCITLVVTGLYLAKMYGVNVPASTLPALALTIILLSLGCPGVPGAAIVCTGIVLEQLGVPIGAIGLIIAINPLVDMFQTMSNTTGDVACSLITARSEGLLNKDVYDDMSRV